MDLNIFEKIAFSCAALLAFWLVVMLVVYCPFQMHADKQCLEAGYPKASITYDFEYYCVGIDGAVFDRVKRGE